MKRLNSSEIRQLLRQQLGKKIDQQFVEKWSASFWKEAKCHQDTAQNPFVMMLPPPNITGNLHLGHALTAAVQDAIIRHRQMQGKRALWVPGFDHAGLSTQNIVERLLWAKEKKTRQEIGRAKFLELANEWKDSKRTEMKEQLNRLGLLLDYDREYFTMDEKSSLSVHAAFKKLFNDGIIYRAIKPVYWSEQLQTTLSDIEVDQVDGQNRYSRTGEIVEKRPVSQWFVNAKELAHKAVTVIEDTSIDMIPPNYKRSWSSWLIKNGVEDWCISRQSWWGHRIPAYKLNSTEDSQANWIVADNDDEASQLLGSNKGFSQDPDVLDTWFSSSLLPLTISGWPCEQKFSENCKEGLFPLDIMETGFDILTFWVSKMVMMSLALENRIPFKIILLHGMICDSEGKKMSKSKGNVIDPLDVIDGTSLNEMKQRTKDLEARGLLESNQLGFILKNQAKLFPSGIPACGADGLRAYLLSHDIQEEVVRVQVGQIEKVRRLSNKIWNIFRLVLTHIEASRNLNLALENNILDTDLSLPDQQVLKALAECVIVSYPAFNDTYQFQVTFQKLELFWTLHLSSEYLRSVKHILLDRANDETEYKIKLQILIKCLVTATKLMHPFMPHLTEFLYQKLSLSLLDDSDEGVRLKSLCLESFPKLEDWERLK